VSVILDYPEAREFDLGETAAAVASRQSSATAAPRATGITAFVKNGGYAAEVAAIANNEVERIATKTVRFRPDSELYSVRWQRQG
jgi:hypothetical protein